MKKHYLKWLTAGALLLASLTGCGGGGGGGGSSQPDTVVNGTASKGIIYPGTINVYAVNSSGAKGAHLAGPIATSVNGKYTASLGPYSGAILVEVNGTYTDEATGRPVIIPASKPLHAMVDSVDNSTKNNKVVAVTPLTELAWRKASSNGTAATTPAAMVTANKLVDDLFKISDIVGVEPVRPDNATVANAGQESQAYTLVLATLSKMASTAAGATDNDKMEATLAGLATEIASAATSGSMSTMAGAFATALGTARLSFDSTSDASVDFPSAAAQLSGMGKKSQLLTLATTGTLPTGTKIYIIQGTLQLPFDAVGNKLKVSFRNEESTGQTMSDVLLLTGAAATSGGDSNAHLMALQQELTFSVVLNASGTGIGTGDFAALAYDLVPNMPVYTVTATDFSLVAGSVSVKDSNGADISGITVTLR